MRPVRRCRASAGRTTHKPHRTPKPGQGQAIAASPAAGFSGEGPRRPSQPRRGKAPPRDCEMRTARARATAAPKATRRVPLPPRDPRKATPTALAIRQRDGKPQRHEGRHSDVAREVVLAHEGAEGGDGGERYAVEQRAESDSGDDAIAATARAPAATTTMARRRRRPRAGSGQTGRGRVQGPRPRWHGWPRDGRRSAEALPGRRRRGSAGCQRSAEAGATAGARPVAAERAAAPSATNPKSGQRAGGGASRQRARSCTPRTTRLTGGSSR